MVPTAFIQASKTWVQTERRGDLALGKLKRGIIAGAPQVNRLALQVNMATTAAAVEARAVHAEIRAERRFRPRGRRFKIRWRLLFPNSLRLRLFRTDQMGVVPSDGVEV